MDKKAQVSDGLRIAIGIVLLIAFFGIMIYIFTKNVNVSVLK